MHLLPATLYILILGGCGLLVSRALRSPSQFAELGFVSVFGTLVFLLLVNGFGYFLPIKTASVTALAIIGVFDLVGFLWLWRRGMFLRSERDDTDTFAMGFLCILTLAVGFAGARYIGSDPWSWQHFPLASTIVAGNFPVHSPIDPEMLLRYHYAPALLAAAFTLLTGLPLTVGFAFQPLIGAAGILFFSAALIRRFRPSSTAMIGAILALAGSGLVWCKYPELSALAHAAVGLTPLRPALGGLADLVGTPLTTSPLVFLGHRSTATGFPLLYGLLYASSFLFGSTGKRAPVLFVVFLFALGLTLTMELAFVTVSMTAVGALILFVSTSATRAHARSLLTLGMAALVPALFIALFHGGVLSGLLDGGHGSFVFRPSFTVTFDTYGNTAFILSARFLRDFGFPLFLFPCAIVVAWARRREEPVWLLISLLALLHFALPFLFDYELIRGEMHRVFYGATSLMAMLAGVFIADTLLSKGSFILRMLGWILCASMLLSGALYLALRLVIPTMRFEDSPLFAPMPAISAEQSALYDWVNAHTTPSDYFYVRNLTVHFETITDEATVQMRDRILFTTYTGRFTIGPIIYWDYRPEWLADVKKAEETCDAAIMKKLRVRYLLVETPDRASWFTRRCRSSDWTSVYQAPGGRLPKVYELR